MRPRICRKQLPVKWPSASSNPRCRCRHERLSSPRRPHRLVIAERHRRPGPTRRRLAEAHHRREMVQPPRRRLARRRPAVQLLACELLRHVLELRLPAPPAARLATAPSAPATSARASSPPRAHAALSAGNDGVRRNSDDEDQRRWRRPRDLEARTCESRHLACH
jgi:hypothetical protein